jgi:hypothetical protein
LVLESLSELDRDRRAEWRRQTVELLRSALLEIPGSRHTRLALAEHCVRDAQQTARRGDLQKAAALASEALSLLSVDPHGAPGVEMRWFNLKAEAAGIFDGRERRAFLDALCEEGVEAGWLLKAELLIAQDNLPAWAAVELLAPQTQGNRASTGFRIARRAAELMATYPGGREQAAERYRLLKLVEDRAPTMTPDEEYQLACLSYQLGEYQEGKRRFAALRSSQRWRDVEFDGLFLSEPGTSVPRRFRGVVVQSEEHRGWFEVRDEQSSAKLFEAPFRARAFGDSRLEKGAHRLISIRLNWQGPSAVPARQARQID